MIKPPQSPRTEHKKVFHLNPSVMLKAAASSLMNTSLSVMETALARYNKGVNKIVEIINYHFKVDSIFSLALRDIMLVAKKLVKKDP